MGHAELEGVYNTLPDLLDAVSRTQAFADCFARNWLSFFLEQPLRDIDAAWVAPIARVVQSDGSLRDVVVQTIETMSARSEIGGPMCVGL